MILHDLFVQNIAHHKSAQTALQQLETLQQQAHEPMDQFDVRLNQLLVHTDPTMPEHVKLFFLWTRLRHDITHRAWDKGPKTFNDASSLPNALNLVRIRLPTTLAPSIINLLASPIPRHNPHGHWCPKHASAGLPQPSQSWRPRAPEVFLHFCLEMMVISSSCWLFN